jgi:hypothetical protein
MKVLRTIVATAVIVFAVTTVAMAGVQHLGGQGGNAAQPAAAPASYTVQLTGQQLERLAATLAQGMSSAAAVKQPATARPAAQHHKAATHKAAAHHAAARHATATHSSGHASTHHIAATHHAENTHDGAAGAGSCNGGQSGGDHDGGCGD